MNMDVNPSETASEEERAISISSFVNRLKSGLTNKAVKTYDRIQLSLFRKLNKLDIYANKSEGQADGK
jgi:hypothetical protein